MTEDRRRAKRIRKAARRIARIEYGLLYWNHKQHYQNPYPFTLGVFIGRGKVQPAIYDLECLICRAMKEVAEEFEKRYMR